MNNTYLHMCPLGTLFLHLLKPLGPGSQQVCSVGQPDKRSAGLLDAWVFKSLDEVHDETQRRIDEYKLTRPHEALRDIPPIEFLTQRGHADLCAYAWP